MKNYNFHGFEILIDKSQFKLVKDTVDISDLKYNYGIIDKLYFQNEGSKHSLSFVIKDTLSPYFSYDTIMLIRKNKMADADMRPLSAYPIFFDSTSYIKYCFLIDTINVVPNYIQGVIENEQKKQIEFSFFFDDKIDLKLAQEQTINILKEITTQQ